MTATIIFIGSSAAAKAQARAIIRHFSSPKLRFLPWWDVFTAGRTLIKDLDHVRGRVDGALLLFTPESSTRIRNKRQDLPNLNVLFELGYIHISGSRSFRRGRAVPVGKRTAREFGRWAESL